MHAFWKLIWVGIVDQCFYIHLQRKFPARRHWVTQICWWYFPPLSHACVAYNHKSRIIAFGSDSTFVHRLRVCWFLTRLTPRSSYLIILQISGLPVVLENFTLPHYHIENLWWRHVNIRHTWPQTSTDITFSMRLPTWVYVIIYPEDNSSALSIPMRSINCEYGATIIDYRHSDYYTLFYIWVAAFSEVFLFPHVWHSCRAESILLANLTVLHIAGGCGVFFQSFPGDLTFITSLHPSIKTKTVVYSKCYFMLYHDTVFRNELNARNLS